MTSTVTEHADLLLPLLQTAIPTITACTILDTIVQANAQGCRVSVHPEEHSSDLFVKHVVAADYSRKKQWNDLRRTLLYGRTEVRFYKELLPLLPGLHGCAPYCHIAEYNLDELIADDSIAYHDANEDAPQCLDNALAKDRGAFLVLDSMGSDYYQESPLSQQQAIKCLQVVAQLHAAAWQNVPLLQSANQRMARGSYHLSTRNPNELAGMVTSWNHFLSEFDNRKLLSQPSIRNLGKRMYAMAEYVSEQLTPLATDPYATLVHGDFKAMNVFLPRDDSQNAVMIDFASTGVGLGMSDVAMHIIHAVEPTEDNYEEALVNAYLEALEKVRAQDNPDCKPYPREVAMRHYRLACVDYVRFIMGRFWKSATKESFEAKKTSKNTTLINRNVDAAMSWISKVDKYLHEFELEKAACE